MRRTALVLLIVGFAGCAPNLAAMSAGAVGCPAESIAISDEDETSNFLTGERTRTWRAACGGRVFQCSQSNVGTPTSCTPMMTSGGEQAQPQITAGQTPTGQRSVTLAFEAAPFRFQFVTAPALDPARFQLVLQLPPTTYNANAQCPVGLMIDGQIYALESPRYESGPQAETWAAFVPNEVADRLGTGHRVVGRVCSHEWRFDEGIQRAIDEWNARRREEAGWTGGAAPTPPPAEPPPPTEPPPDEQPPAPSWQAPPGV